MELSYRYSNAKQAEIGVVFGVDYSTVSQSRARLRAKLKSSRKLNKQFRQIKEQVINLSISKIWPYLSLFSSISGMFLFLHFQAYILKIH